MAADDAPVGAADRWRRFGHRPFRERLRVLMRYHLAPRFLRVWQRLLPGLPVPCRLPFGGWWLAEPDVEGTLVFVGVYEADEWRFVARILAPGMRVIDVGAHHGFYTLLASRLVGATGRVVAFEPSPRERARLQRHLRINRCGNVGVEAVALGAADGAAELWLSDADNTGANSLRPAAGVSVAGRVKVRLATLDGYLDGRGRDAIDFLKIDAEGAELEILRGAIALLARVPRPIVMCETDDTVAAPWGHSVRDLLEFLGVRGFRWFAVAAQGRLIALDVVGGAWPRNAVAVPEERLPLGGGWPASEVAGR